MARSGGAPAACGHGTAAGTVSEGRCWDCHLAHLRATGAGDRADRLTTIRRQHDEGRFDYPALLQGLAVRLMEEFEWHYDDPDSRVPRPVWRRHDLRP